MEILTKNKLAEYDGKVKEVIHVVDTKIDDHKSATEDAHAIGAITGLDAALATINGGITAGYYFRAYDATSEAGNTYLGYSTNGTLTSSPDWDIKKYDNKTGLYLTAKGAYDDRLTLTYE